MEGIKPPRGLILTGEAANLEKFVQLFSIYLEATNLKSSSEERKIALFLNTAGEEALEIYNNFNKKYESLEELLKDFRVYSQPRQGTLINTFQFLNMKQGEDEPIEHFIMRLKKLGKKCQFGELEDRLETMMLIVGIKDKNLKESMLRIEGIKLEEAIKMCRAAEEGKRQVRKLEENEKVHMLRSGRQAGNSKVIVNCARCGRTHPINNCPAYKRICAACNKYNHFASQCTTNKSRRQQSILKTNNSKKINLVEEQHSEEEANKFKLDDVSYIYNINRLQWNVKIQVDNVEINCKLDTGADCNTLPLNIFNKINYGSKYELQKCNKILVVYNGQRIYPLGTVILNCIVKGAEHTIKFTVIDIQAPSVLGLSDCIRLNLIKKIDKIDCNYRSKKEKFIADNKNIFTGLGLIGTYKIQIQEGAQPVVKPIRRIPVAIKERLKETLDNYEKRKVIEKVEGPTRWCNNLVIVEKPDKSLRLCLDPKELNKNILREKYQIPSPEELYNSLAGKEVFSVLDLKDGFFQIELQDDDKLCTFGTPFGRYRFLRMPFGISSAPEVMQKINHQIFGDIVGVEIYYDDVIISAKSTTEHDLILEKVMERAKKYNVKFNENKLQYKLDHVKYVGLIVSKTGIQVDPDHIKAITELKEPTKIKELQKFLGMCNYLSKFIPQYTKTTEPLRQLLKKENEWCWGDSQKQAFIELKSKLSCAPTLGILSNEGMVTLQTDSSKDGMGACLLQKGRPISFYSRSYTDCQKRWAPIEKELFAICASLEKYHQFVYGRKIRVETDHKPLVAIVSKDINKISSRLQRMVLKLIKYDIEIKYVPGSKMYIADYLSRHFINDNAQVDQTIKELVHGFETELAVSDKKLLQIQQESLKDSNLTQIIEWYEKGFPNNDKNIVNRELKMYFKLRTELHVKNNIVYFNDRIVIPFNMRKEILTKLHTGHIGIVKCKKRIKTMLYWPGMGKDIEEFILSCSTCEKFRVSNCKEPLILHEVPDLPFCKVGMDIATYGIRDYLVVVDYYSRWIEVKEIKDKTANTVIEKLKSIFAVHGIPKIIVSDNMPFSSYKFQQFTDSCGIQLVHSSPRYPQSNGLSEKAVGIVKGLIKKCEDSNTDFNLALLNYRTTPVAGLDYSPSQLLMSRMLRTILPCSESHLKPELPVDVNEKIVRVREKMKGNYDRNAVSRKEFKSGETVRFQNRPDRIWYPGEIVKQQGTRSYIVKTEKGTLVRRNTKHLNHSRNSLVMKPEIECYMQKQRTPDPKLEFTGNKDSSSEGITSRNDSVANTNINNEGITSRSGRVIRKPIRYNDYV